MASHVFDTYIPGGDDNLPAFLDSLANGRIICFTILVSTDIDTDTDTNINTDTDTDTDTGTDIDTDIIIGLRNVFYKRSNERSNRETRQSFSQ